MEVPSVGDFIATHGSYSIQKRKKKGLAWQGTHSLDIFVGNVSYRSDRQKS
jgi:hypothetical protein